MLIWWTTQEDCEATMALKVKSKMPKYLRDEFISRIGRAGRGRLWVAKRFKITSIDWNENCVAARYCERAGGIVFDETNLSFVKSLHGIVTDLKMNIIASNFDKIQLIEDTKQIDGFGQDFIFGTMKQIRERLKTKKVQ